MKVTAFGKCTGGKICELELKERRAEHIADVSRSVRPGECRACIGDQWQVRAIERDTGRLIVFPHVFDDPDEAAHQFAKVCRSPHYRSVDIALVLD